MYIPNVGELAVFIASFLGGLIGFLWYNTYPATVFMGDTGSLSIGAIISVIAVIVRNFVGIVESMISSWRVGIMLRLVRNICLRVTTRLRFHELEIGTLNSTLCVVEYRIWTVFAVFLVVDEIPRLNFLLVLLLRVPLVH